MVHGGTVHVSTGASASKGSLLSLYVKVFIVVPYSYLTNSFALSIKNFHR